MTVTNQSLLIDVDAVAERLCCSPRHVWALAAAGKMPKPIRLGRAVRWNVEELHRWIEAGAPHNWPLTEQAQRGGRGVTA